MSPDAALAAVELCEAADRSIAVGGTVRPLADSVGGTSGVNGDSRRLRAAIAALPRVPLGTLPTPLVEAPRLARAIGVGRLLIKRDDLTGVGVWR